MYKKSKEEYSGDVEDDLTKFIATAGILIIILFGLINIIL